MSRSNRTSCRVSVPANERFHKSCCRRRRGTLSRRVYLRYVEDRTIGCGGVINAGLDGRDEHARGIWVGLLGEVDEDVLDV